MKTVFVLIFVLVSTVGVYAQVPGPAQEYTPRQFTPPQQQYTPPPAVPNQPLPSGIIDQRTRQPLDIRNSGMTGSDAPGASYSGMGNPSK